MFPEILKLVRLCMKAIRKVTSGELLTSNEKKFYYVQTIFTYLRFFLTWAPTELRRMS
jgi:hypothetical protein